MYKQIVNRYFENFLISCLMCYLTVYSFIEIKVLLLIEFIYELYYSDYYKIIIFKNNKIDNLYVNKDLSNIDVANKIYDLLIFENNRNCFLINDKKEYSNFTLSNFIKKSVLPHNDILMSTCNFTFNLIVVCINDKEYEIKLRNYYYNFYIVGNKINMNFIKYYAIKYLKIKDLIVEYSLIIIDNNCNYIDNLSHKDTIVLYENKYELK